MYTKKVLKEVEVVDAEILKPETKIYFKSRISYSIDLHTGEESGFWDDEGEGFIVNSDESGVHVKYDGYWPNHVVYLSIEDLNSGFYEITMK